MRRKKFDIVHTVEEAGAIGCVLTRLFGGRHVFEKHSDPVSHRGGMLKNAVLSLYDRVETVVIRRADAVIATGPGLRGQALQKSPESIVHAVSDIPSSLEEAKTDAVQKTRNAILQNGDEILVLYVGSFAAYQGIDLMFETAVRVIERCPRTRFVIIGGSDAEIGSRKKWLSGKHIRSHVTFTGKIPPDSLPEYLKAADILLSPRLHGVNTPLKLLDYLKSGRAIVAVDSEANRQILDDRSAVFAKPDVEAFAHSLCRVIEDAPLRDSLGKAARACYERRYTFEVFMRSLESVYRGAARLERDGSPSR
jgi:glycosyltransferase involved in cell wall biosynthesis